MPLHDRVVICEGAIKSIVTRCYGIEDESISVIAVPAKSVWCGVEEAVKHCAVVWVILDPDAGSKAIELAKRIGKAARVVELPDNVDDALMGGMMHTDLANYMRYSRKA